MKITIDFMRRNALDVMLWLLSGVCLMLMFKSSSDPYPETIKGTWLEYWLQPFSVGNQIVFDISVGVIVSLFVYVLIVRLPEYKTRLRLKANLLRQYDALKEDCIMHFLWACGESAETTLIDRLKDREEFRAFFKEPVSSCQNRWDAVFNGLDERKVDSLLFELEVFRQEIEYTLNTVDVSDSHAFAFLRRLTRLLHRSRRWSDENDQLKSLLGFMWSIHTGWNDVYGYSGRDSVADMIEAI